MAGSEHRLDRLMLELEQVVLRGDPWLEEAKSCLGWLDANFGTVRWTSFLNEGDAEGGGGADVGRITNCSGILERAVDLLQALDSCSGYLEAGLAIARRNGGAVDPEHAVMLLKKTDWCKATRDRNTRKNFSRRLLDSGLFREDRTSGLLLLIEVHGPAPMEEGDAGPADSGPDGPEAGSYEEDSLADIPGGLHNGVVIGGIGEASHCGGMQGGSGEFSLKCGVAGG